MWGVWVATAGGLDFPLAEATTQGKLDKHIDNIISVSERAGIDTLFFQARACGDAYYHSRYFPKPHGLPEGYDPLARLIEKAHERGLALHAWINPYRVKYPDSLSEREVAPCYKVLGEIDLVHYKDGSVHLNPTSQRVMNLVGTCVDELIEVYDIDGVHMDDRYYPSRDFEDGIQAENQDDVDAMRRDHVTDLVRVVHQRVKASEKNLLFGISPHGVWAHGSSHPLGSNTCGVEAYHDHYADVIRWMREGLINYVLPQLYHRCGDADADYETLLKWWVTRAKETHTDLVIGHGAYWINDASQPLFDLMELDRQFRLNCEYPSVKGSAFFRMSSLMENPEMVKHIHRWSVKE